MPELSIMRIIARLNVGGPAIHTILLTQHFREQRDEALLVCGNVSEQEGDMTYFAEEHQVSPIVIDELGREISLWDDIVAIFKLVRLMRKHRPQIVHTHTSKAGFVGRIAAWIARVPVRVHTFHGHVFHSYFGPAKTRIFIWIERLLSKITSCIITISPELHNELAATYKIASPNKITTIPLGLELQALASAAENGDDCRTQYNLPENKKLVGIVGRLVPVKNHEFFLRIAQALARDDTHFVIIGDGECRPELEHQVKAMGLEDKITFTSWVKNIGPILKTLDVLALTSKNEGTPIALIEAMAVGIPVVATAVGGVPDTLEHGKLGHLVEPEDLAGFVEVLDRTLEGDHPDLKMVQETIIHRYDISRLVQDLRQLYEMLL